MAPVTNLQSLISLFFFTLGCIDCLAIPSALNGRDDIEQTDSYKVLRVYVDSQPELDILNSLQHAYTLDPWRQATLRSGSGDYMIANEKLPRILEKFDSGGINHEVMVHDVHKYFQENDPLHHVIRRKRAINVNDFRFKYLPYEEILRYLQYIQQHSRNLDVQLGSIGLSYEKRTTPFVKISQNSSDSPKRIIFIDGGFHSREWISPAMVLEMIHRLVVNAENDTDVQSLLRHYDFVLVPVVNPDGYDYTFEPGLNARLWRKSRVTNYTIFPECYGVDLNRNFGFQWNDSPYSGGSSRPCSGTYSGPYSFSEPETRNLRDLLLEYKPLIDAYLTFHSFGQFFLYPWGFSSEVDIENEPELHNAGLAFANTMKKRNFPYNVGGTAKTLYPAAGGSDDYVHGTVGVKYAYTVELPPLENSSFGFLLPEAEVGHVVSNTWVGLKDFFFHILQNRLQSEWK